MQFVNQNKWFYRKFYKKTGKIVLGFKNLYIFPNLFGLYWILTLITIYILGINLENNLTVFISYLMIIVFVISLFLTHFNIHGLELISINQKINFANSEIKYRIILDTKKIRNNIKLKFLNEENKFIFIEKIVDRKIESLPIKGKKRGIYNPDIIYGESSSPFYLFNCWFYWQPIENFVVAPQKKKGKINKQDFKGNKNKNKNKNYNNKNGDQFINIKPYREGERKSSIHWKSMARSRILLSKNFANENTNDKWLLLNKNLPIEKALEHLCFEIYNHYQNNKVFGILLSKNEFITPNKSEKHYLKCLTMLANYNHEKI